MLGRPFVMKLVALAAASGAISVPPNFCLAAEGSNKKSREKPVPAGEQLRRAVRNLSKQKDYEATYSYEGGVSADADHKISAQQRSSKYVGRIHGNRIMHVPEHKTFRTSKKGVAQVEGAWKSLGSDAIEVGARAEAARMHHAFSFPLEILSQAARYSKTAKPVEGVKAAAESGQHVVRIEVPPEESTKLYTSLPFSLRYSVQVTEGGTHSFVNASYEISIDAGTELPRRIELTVLSATMTKDGKSQAEIKDGKIVGGRHFVYRFKYSLSKFGELGNLEIPPEATAALR